MDTYGDLPESPGDLWRRVAVEEATQRRLVALCRVYLRAAEARVSVSFRSLGQV